MSKDKSTDGLRINGMTPQGYKQSLVPREAAATKPNEPQLAAPEAEPQLAAPEARRLYDPPWSYLDPDNPGWEQFRKNCISRAVEPALTDATAADRGDPVSVLLKFFEVKGKEKRFVGLRLSLWEDEAREAGIKFSENAFQRAWKLAKIQNLVTPRRPGAPNKAEQAKRRRLEVIPPKK